MKRKRLSEIPNIILSDEKKVKISKSGNDIIFEIGKEITSDIAEGVSIMMRFCEQKSKIWDLEIDTNSEIIPEKSLFWLTGGSQEWNNLENYKKPWCECYLEFQEEFGMTIINIVKKSKKLSDIKEGFNKYLNLPTLYDFAISKKLV